MIDTLRQRNFALLWFAGLISLMGNWMLHIALPVAVYEMTGSALAVGGMLVARTIPALVFSAIAGVFVDRWERRRTIVVINVLLAVSIMPLLLVSSPDWLWLIYVVSFLQSTFGQFFAPAENAFLPLLSDQKLLVSANALNALNNNLARLIGPALGGIITPILGLHGVVFIDAVTYLVAAILCALITVTSHPGKTDSESNTISVNKIISEWMAGLRLIWGNRAVRGLFILNIPPAIGESIMYVLFVPFVTDILHGDSVHVGGLMSAQAVGGIIGGMVISWIAHRISAPRLLGVCALIFGFVDFALFNYSTFFSGIALAYGLIALAGPLAVGIGAGYNTMVQTHVEDAYRGRVFGTLNLLASLFTLIGIAFAGFAGDAIGIVPTINVQAYGYMLVGILSLWIFRERRSAQLAVATGD